MAMKGTKGNEVSMPNVTQLLVSQARRGIRHMPKVHMMKLTEVIFALKFGETCSITEKRFRFVMLLVIFVTIVVIKDV